MNYPFRVTHKETGKSVVVMGETKFHAVQIAAPELQTPPNYALYSVKKL